MNAWLKAEHFSLPSRVVLWCLLNDNSWGLWIRVEACRAQIRFLLSQSHKGRGRRMRRRWWRALAGSILRKVERLRHWGLNSVHPAELFGVSLWCWETKVLTENVVGEDTHCRWISSFWVGNIDTQQESEGKNDKQETQKSSKII